MFGGHGHLEKKLRKSGAKAQAVVRTAHNTLRGPEIASHQYFIWNLTLLVRPAGEAAFDASLDQRFWKPLEPVPGSLLNVLYDPTDHSKVAIDTELTAVGPKVYGQLTSILDPTADEAAAVASLASSDPAGAGVAFGDATSAKPVVVGGDPEMLKQMLLHPSKASEIAASFGVTAASQEGRLHWAVRTPHGELVPVEPYPMDGSGETDRGSGAAT
jgi:hypothetical protein